MLEPDLPLRSWDRGSPEAIEIEADPRHAEIMVHQAGLDNPSSKEVVTPGVKGTADEGTALEGARATLFRSMAMRASYLAEDRPEIRFASKEAARWMSTPCTLGMDVVKRIVRFLKGAPRMIQRMEKQARV